VFDVVVQVIEETISLVDLPSDGVVGVSQLEFVYTLAGLRE
jgi:hypothetical protein